MVRIQSPQRFSLKFFSSVSTLCQLYDNKLGNNYNITILTGYVGVGVLSEDNPAGSSNYRIFDQKTRSLSRPTFFGEKTPSRPREFFREKKLGRFRGRLFSSKKLGRESDRVFSNEKTRSLSLPRFFVINFLGSDCSENDRVVLRKQSC